MKDKVREGKTEMEIRGRVWEGRQGNGKRLKAMVGEDRRCEEREENEGHGKERGEETGIL